MVGTVDIGPRVDVKGKKEKNANWAPGSIFLCFLAADTMCPATSLSYDNVLLAMVGGMHSFET